MTTKKDQKRISRLCDTIDDLTTENNKLIKENQFLRSAYAKEKMIGELRASDDWKKTMKELDK